MAKFFLAYDFRDRDIAQRLEKGLQAKTHQSVWGVDELLAGKGWGELMPRRLAAADAVVAILTPNSAHSPSVWCEIGAARALANTEKRTALLPVIIGLDKAPRFTEDILVLWGARANGQDNADLIGEIDRAIRAHLASLATEAKRTTSPRIFVSHRHKDQKVAAALVETLRMAFDLSPSDIRCTSVQPYRLPFGKNTGERLRNEIGSAQAVLGILSPDTSESTYVMFELGAAWSRQIYTCPLLSKGAEHSHIPAPIFDLAPARLWEVSDCNQLLANLEGELNLTRNRDVQGAVSERIAELARVAAGPV